jgi:hypothetical protein
MANCHRQAKNENYSKKKRRTSFCGNGKGSERAKELEGRKNPRSYIAFFFFSYSACVSRKHRPFVYTYAPTHGETGHR